MTTDFSELGLDARLLATLVDRGYTAPTPIQSALIPVMMAGRDAIGQAQTGTGKTAAFSLPILNRLVPKAGHIQALVLAPTRELAMQVADTMYAYGKNLGVRVLPVYGGQPYGRQISRLRKGVDIVVGTPGRLLDLMNQGALDLSQVSTVVLDEADEMLSMGFIEDIESILSATPSERQTALLSATMPGSIKHLSRKYLRDPETCSVTGGQRTAVEINQRAYLVNYRDKVAAMTRIFESEEVTSALIFARTRAGTTDLANELTSRGFPAEAINGEMSQDARTRVLSRFRSGHVKMLVGTDVAARGLDIDDISHVFNYDLPRDPEVYVHRIGRTGRAGNTGEAITLYAPNETGKLRRIESYTKERIVLGALPSADDIEKLRTERMVEKMDVWVKRGRCHTERELIQRLVDEGGDVIELAAAALRMARTAENPRPVELIDRVEARRPSRSTQSGNGPSRSTQGGNRPIRGNRHRPIHAPAAPRHSRGMVQLSLDTGRESGIQVNHVVSTIAHHAGIAGSEIGRIRIDDDKTFVDVSESVVSQVLAKTGELRFGKHRIEVELA